MIPQAPQAEQPRQAQASKPADFKRGDRVVYQDQVYIVSWLTPKRVAICRAYQCRVGGGIYGLPEHSINVRPEKLNPWKEENP